MVGSEEFSARGFERWTENFAGKPQRRAHMKNLDVSGRIILNWILEQQDVRV